MPEPTATTAAAATDAMPASAAQARAAVIALNHLFVQALRRIGDCGNADDLDAACRLAARGWSLLRRDWPRDAERLNGVMHSLTGPRHAAQPARAAKMPEIETDTTTEYLELKEMNHERQ